MINKRIVSFILSAILAVSAMTSCSSTDSSSEVMGELPETNSTVSRTESNKEDISSGSVNNNSSDEDSSSKAQSSANRYIVSELNPKEFFTSLSYYNTDKIKWKSSTNLTLEDLAGKTEGLYRFNIAGGEYSVALYIAMSEGKCIRVRSEIGGISDGQNKDEIYDVFKIFLYTVFPEVSDNALDTVKNEVIEWAEAHPVKGDTQPKEFKVEQTPINVYYDTASISSKKVYDGFHCIIEFKN